MFTIKRHWIINLSVFGFLMASLAISDSSKAAFISDINNSSLQATSSDRAAVGLHTNAQQFTSKIESGLLTAIEKNGKADFIMRFTAQADLSPAYSMDWNARGEFVYNSLRNTAAKSQENAKTILDAAGLKYQTFIAGNELYVWSGTLVNVNKLAALPEVNFIQGAKTYTIDPIDEIKPFQNISWAGDFLANYAITTVGDSTTAVTDWGITDTKADQFWTGFGVKGDGIVVANIDTGVQWNHPALVNQFKCTGNPTNPACWNDPANICGAGGACDNNGHGTHTMGTMVGKDDPALTYNVGMAPNAKWIACKGCESSSCTSASLLACADWILAPAGNPSNRPNIVNNSWGGTGGDSWYLSKVQAWRAAGIFPAFSSGNPGSTCGLIGSPSDYQESFASGGYDSSRNVYTNSGRGPSIYGHAPYTKPNISSPAVNVISSYPTNQWAYMTGTSMASPHTAGAVALLWSCNSALVGQIDATFQLLQNNTDITPAGNCGAPPDGQGNYTFGYGYLNILKVGQAGCAPTEVSLSDFTATTVPQGVQLSWKTAQETDLLGFNLYRSESAYGLRLRINQTLIPAISPGQLQGNRYQYLDGTAKAGKIYYYWVEWVSNQNTELFGPTATSLAPYWLWLPLGLK
jgi:subtilisin family serine protease